MSRRRRALTPATGVLLVVVALVAACRSSTTPGSPVTSGSVAATGTSGSTAASSSIPGGPSRTVSPRPSGSVPLITDGYVALFPFADLQDAQAWERGYPQGGHQPWHLSPDLTALSFTQGFLGFAEIDRITTRRSSPNGMHIGVGYRNPAGRAVTAAVLHLMRFGTDAKAPWEVVGSDDTTFTLDRPAYGATVTSPFLAGGLTTGVDENISLTVRQLGTENALGRAGPVPAGEHARPWSLRVSYSGARRGALTLAAATGGHVQRVERFAITGLYAR